jgi:hypothetical protein
MAESIGYRRHRRVRETAAQGYSPGPPREGVAGFLLDSDIVMEILRGRADALVAAAATTAGLSLWTLDRKHYSMRDVRLWEAPRA